MARFARTGDPNETGSELPGWAPWSNGVDEAKCILFDVDSDAPDITMGTTEITIAGVLAAMQSEVPEPLYSEAREYLSTFSMVAHLLAFI